MVLEHETHVDRPSQAHSDQRHILVLYARVGLLLLLARHAILRREAQRLAADVRPPHCHHTAASIQLRVQLHPSRRSCALSA